MLSLLNTEREQAGWRFLLIWLIASNIGFSLGILLELLLFKQVNLYIAVPLAGIGQAYIVNRHVSIYLPWAVGTAIFWIIGLAIAYPILNTMMTPQNWIQHLISLIIISIVGGFLAGIPQWFFLREWLPKIGIWWLLVSAVSWAVVIIPGLITGIVLMRFITEQKVNMDNRHYILSSKHQ